MSLLSLSNELITGITEILHPSTIVNFALTCHRLYECASGSLALHRSRQKELRAHHDRNPTNIIDLARMANTSPELLWYVRILEFYGSRSSWEDWKTYSDYESVKDEPKFDLSSSGDEQLAELDLESLFQNFSLDQYMQDSMERTRKGDDEPLKALLIASCPNIEKITWVAHEPNDDSQPFSILCDLISAHQPLPQTIWVPGLRSLRSISLGTCIEHVHPRDNLHPNVPDFCRLLLLPNLKSLRINVAGFGDSELEYLNTHVPARSSSVEEITLYISDFDQAKIVAILERCRSLKVYHNIYLGEWTNILEDIQPWFSDTLEELRPEGSNDWNMRLYKDLSTFSGFTKLRVFNVYVGDLIKEGISITEDKFKQDIAEGTEVQWHDFHAVLPSDAEEIIFGWPPRAYNEQLKEQNLHTTVFPAFFEQLNGLVQRRGSGKRNRGCLKTIALEFLEKEMLVRCIGNKEADKLLGLIDEWSERWTKAGVQVVMRSQRNGYQDEVLECRPSSPSYDDDD
jgi:hypothetical protein